MDHRGNVSLLVIGAINLMALISGAITLVSQVQALKKEVAAGLLTQQLEMSRNALVLAHAIIEESPGSSSSLAKISASASTMSFSFCNPKFTPPLSAGLSFDRAHCEKVISVVDLKELSHGNTKQRAVASTQLASAAPSVLNALLDVAPAVATCEVTRSFGEDPFSLPALINASIKKNGFKYQPLKNDIPIIRSVQGSGGANQWNDGKILVAQMKQICQLFGFSDYVDSSCADTERSGIYPRGKCYFHSPQDNQMQILAISKKSSQVFPAGDKYANTWLASISCKTLRPCQ